MLASFSVIPLGVGEKLGEFVAGIVPLIEDSGLPYRIGAMQTTVEGEEEQVLALVMSCHHHLRQSAPRVVTRITIDDRAGASGRLEGKVKDVEAILGRSLAAE